MDRAEDDAVVVVPVFAPYRDDPRFAKLLAETGMVAPPGLGPGVETAGAPGG